MFFIYSLIKEKFFTITCAYKLKAQKEANKYLTQLNDELELLVGERTIKLEEKNKELSELVIHDSMTGMLNHNASIDYLKMMHKSALRYNKELSVIMLDIDLFKSINDQYGHQSGDRVIIAIANILNKSIRESDGCGRYGGEEFILILPETDDKKAYELAERIRKSIIKLKIIEVNNTTITASFGISIFDPSKPDVDLISEADKALYKAKEAGRNQVKRPS